jgi:hypothetical protein
MPSGLLHVVRRPAYAIKPAKKENLPCVREEGR